MTPKNPQKTITAKSTGTSMYPLIKQGSKLTFSTNLKSLPKPADIIIFSKNEKLTAHRVILKKNQNSKTHFLLKGDNKTTFDGWYPEEKIIGKLTKITYPSYSINLNHPKNRILSYIFLIYSLLNSKLPFLTNLQNLNLPLIKNIYHHLVKTSPKNTTFPQHPTDTKILNLLKELKVGSKFQTTIQTNSMKPTLSRGQKITIVKKPYDNIKKGNIIAFQSPNSNHIVIHRVIKISNSNIYTKGDNNKKHDSWTLSKNNYLGIISES